MKKILFVFVLLAVMIATVGCQPEADVASYNVSQAADNFQVNRRIVFYNGITNEYILVIEGLCSLGNYDDKGELSVTCKVGPTEYKKHYLGLSDNVTYFAEQLDASSVSPFNYKVFFRPAEIVPDIEIQ